MTTSRSDRATAASAVPAPGRPPPPRKAVWTAAGLLALYAVVLLACDVGVKPTDRMYRPDPAPLTPAQTFLGLRDTTWFPIMYCVSAVALGAILWWLAQRWRDAGRAHPATGVLLAFVLLSMVDPLISWATFTSYNPELIHFPTNWWWFNLAPVVHTAWVTGAYSMFYLVPTLAGFFFWRTGVARAGPDSVVRRFPLASTWTFGTVVGFVYDIPTELLLINMNIWHYSQWFGPTVSMGTATVPLTESLWTGLLVGGAISVLQMDDRGRPRFVSTLSRRTGFRWARRSDSGAIIALLGVVYAGYLISFTAIRAFELSDATEKQWPFSNTKVYDPYGDAASNGVPGPYYPGVGAWKLTGN